VPSVLPFGSVIASFPSPPTNGVSIGSLRLHLYGLTIAVAIAVAVALIQRRWARLGGNPAEISALALWGVPGGLIGARIYSLVTSWQADTGGVWYRSFEIWHGGLGIWGGIAGGVAAGYVGSRVLRLPARPLLDCCAPAFALAQAIGRWGNYFNQELYGKPTSLPWAVRIDPAHRPARYLGNATFQPTFLYECGWDLIVFGLLLWAERRFRIRRGYLFALYASLYTFGRFWIESLRIDESKHFLGLRLNDWTSILVFVVSSVVLLTWGRPRPGDDLVGDPLRSPTPDTTATAVPASSPERPVTEGSELTSDPDGAPVPASQPTDDPAGAPVDRREADRASKVETAAEPPGVG
jgi:prolipoprotein diacylglyceryl transferase